MDWLSRSIPLPSTTGEPKARFLYVLGWDIAGTVIVMGEGVEGFSPGDAVYGMPRFPEEARAYSEFAAVPARDLAHKPESLTWEEAATLPMVGLTAWQALFDTTHLQEGETIFIPAGSGSFPSGNSTCQMERSQSHRLYFNP